MSSPKTGYISQHVFNWFFISLSKYHAYCFSGGEGQTPLCCQCIQLAGYFLQCSRCHLRLLVVMYIARSSAKSDPSIPFPNSPNRKSIMLSICPCGIPRYVCLLCEINPSTLNLIYLSLMSFLINSIILPCIPMFSSCSCVFSLLTLSEAFLLFFLFSWIHWEFLLFLILCLLCFFVS